MHTLQGHSRAVIAVSFSPDGTRIASGSGDKTVKVWDAATGEVVQTLQGHSRLVTAVAFSPDGARLASGSFDERVKVWDAATGARGKELKCEGKECLSVALSAAGRVATGCADGKVRLYDAEGNFRFVVKPAPSSPPRRPPSAYQASPC